MKRILGSIVLWAGLAVAGPGCIIVDDRNDPPYCERCYDEGVLECGNDWRMDECVHGCWEFFTDCDDDCGGYGVCENVGRDDAACYCP